jgi:hypothetical protein
MATFTPAQYQQVQQVQQQIFALMQEPTLWGAQNIQQNLTAAYNALDVIATYIALLGTG